MKIKISDKLISTEFITWIGDIIEEWHHYHPLPPIMGVKGEPLPSPQKIGFMFPVKFLNNESPLWIKGTDKEELTKSQKELIEAWEQLL